jgi:hypothetical protein
VVWSAVYEAWWVECEAGWRVCEAGWEVCEVVLEVDFQPSVRIPGPQPDLHCDLEVPVESGHCPGL